MTVFDTTFLIDLERRKPSALDLLHELEASRVPLRVPAAAWLEFLAAMPPIHRHHAALHLARSVECESFTKEHAEKAAGIWFELARSGVALSWHDVQVASTALALNEPLVTNDAVFARVPGLAVVPH
ncbi:MAG TPA: PIN domain-containing protein [Candidatus Thermoplasmatota archaeon]|nr:PIN domain-containing protein [Candidatus Thermoplasmatota archaeon]